MFSDDIYCQPELQHLFVEPEVSVYVCYSMVLLMYRTII